MVLMRFWLLRSCFHFPKNQVREEPASLTLVETEQAVLKVFAQDGRHTSSRIGLDSPKRHRSMKNAVLEVS